MNSERVIIADRQSAVEAIKKLNENDLIFLNRIIVDRLKLISQAQSTCLMANFNIGDRVSFRGPDGQYRQGVIIKLNKKTASIKLTDGHVWNVFPGLLEKPSGSGQAC